MIAEPLVAYCVALVCCVLSAIDFNDQALLPTDEVDDVGTDRFLADELVTFHGPRADAVPESCFGNSRSPTEAPRALGLCQIGTAHAATPPHPPRFARRPLPASGERLETAALQAGNSIPMADGQLFGREQRDHATTLVGHHDLLFDAGGGVPVARRAIGLEREHHALLDFGRVVERDHA